MRGWDYTFFSRIHTSNFEILIFRHFDFKPIHHTTPPPLLLILFRPFRLLQLQLQVQRHPIPNPNPGSNIIITMGLFTGYIGAKCRRYTARRDAITNANCARILAGWKACEAAKEPEAKVIPSLGQMVHEIEEQEKRKLEKEEEERQKQIRAVEEREERMRNEKTGE